MKMNKSTILLIIMAVAVPLAATAAILGFKTQKINCWNAEFSRYVSGWTQGIISKSNTLKVVFVSGTVDSLKRNNLPDNLFEISPAVEGKWKFVDNVTIEFTPDKFFESGTKYTAALKIKALLPEADLNENEFVFDFATPDQNIEMNVNEQVTVTSDDNSVQRVEGEIHTADVEDPELIKKTLTASVDGTQKNIEWKPTSANSKDFEFVVTDIKRTPTAQKLILKLDGNPVKANQKYEKEIEIAACDIFKILSARVVFASSPYIEINFSDALKQNQNLDGLVNVFDSEATFKTEIINNKIIVSSQSRINDKVRLTVASGIQNIAGKKLASDQTFNLDFNYTPPEIHAVKKGVILPTGDHGLLFPFEAVNLKAADVKIVKIFENNVLRFLQDDDLNTCDSWRMYYSGITVFNKTVHFTENPTANKPERYCLDLNKLIKAEPGAIYNISITFRKSHTTLGNSEGDDCSNEQDVCQTDFTQEEHESLWSYSYSGEYEWENRDNPAYKAYYTPDRGIRQNILASNLGLTVKKGLDGTLTAFASDIISANPVSKAQIEVFSKQEQLLSTKSTDDAGMAIIEKIPANAMFVVAKSGTNRAFIKLNDGQSLSLSKFDIKGNAVQNGLQGYLFGERGVWRPGDSIHITFMMKESLENPLPEGLPLIFELKNPAGQTVERIVSGKNKENFRVFNIKTSSDAPTGNYTASVTCGGAYFEKNIKIETVKPNRLKVDLSFDNKILKAENNTATIKSMWLHGAPASNLKAEVTASYKQTSLVFKNFADYTFDDYTKVLSDNQTEIFKGNLNAEGSVQFSTGFLDDESQCCPSKVVATYITKVFEPGGDFSINSTSADLLPYNYYIGIKTPDTENEVYQTDKKHRIDFVLTDNKGTLLNSNQTLKFEFYKLTNDWWWESENGNSNYISRDGEKLIKSENIKMNAGKGFAEIEVNYPEWGQYLLLITDSESGVSAAKKITIDWPSFYGRSPMASEGATMLSFSSDKETYTAGEKVKISFPSPNNGQAIICLENGTRVIKSERITTKAGTTDYYFTADETMAPGVYVDISLLQPHGQTINDLPIRMYGVIPVNIENLETKLNPVISMPDKLEAEQTFTVSVSEAQNKEMTYTLAIVEDGLLDLTNFKTPDPWKKFYSREALGVKTWDIYDMVIGAFGGKIERLFGVGGDDQINQSAVKTADRFEPVVLFFGPFTLKNGKKNHSIKLPKYIGSVRAMVVAGNGKSFGCTEKTCTVTKPLMILGTPPRVIGPDEEFNLPVSIFADRNLGNVSLSIKVDNATVKGSKSAQVNFSKAGEQESAFTIETGKNTGIVKIEIVALAQGHKSVYNCELDIRDANARYSEKYYKAIAAGAQETITFDVHGRTGSNSAQINIAGLLPLNFGQRLNYLIDYPHGCIEQTVSKAFPQLYLSDVSNITSIQKTECENNIKEAVKKIYGFQRGDGGFVYWPGYSYTDDWCTNYAGHFLIEAKKKGYDVDSDVLKKWKTYQKRHALNWADNGKSSYVIQAYRLYTLALADNAETGAMNRMKEYANLPEEAKYHLAAAYAVSGKRPTAEKILTEIGENNGTMTPDDGTYGSPERYRAIILQALCEAGLKNKAFIVAKRLAESMNSHFNYSTQTTAFSLIALSKFFTTFKPASQINASYSLNNASAKNINSEQACTIEKLNIGQSGKQSVSIKNNSSGVIYVEVCVSGNAIPGTEKEISSGLIINEVYDNIKSEIINVDNLKSGTNFTCLLTVTNTSGLNLENVALTRIFPAGWEIINTRIFENNDDDEENSESEESEDYQNNQNTSHDYSDIRDDRANIYFSLKKGESRSFRIQLTATYAGSYYLPGIVCNDQYEMSATAQTTGKRVTVVK